MVGSAAVELSILEAKQLGPKMAQKDLISVRNNGSWKTMEADDFFQEGGCNRFGCEGVANGDEMHVLTQAVYHHKNDIIGGLLKESLDKVH